METDALITEAERCLAKGIAQASRLVIEELENEVFKRTLTLEARRKIQGIFAGSLVGFCSNVAELSDGARTMLATLNTHALLCELQRSL